VQQVTSDKFKLHSLLSILESIAPTHLAEEWDNVGLLVGDAERDVSRAMLAIDYTAAVADEAWREKCELVIAYHPPIFKPIKRLTAGDFIFQAIQRGVAIYSPHTALDVADGGTNDVLGDAIGLTDRGPLRPIEGKLEQLKLVTFVPAEALEKVADALFEAGAGRIGEYTHCSFRSGGTGTFLGQAGTNPAVGQAGRLERAAEVKLETVVPLSRVPAVLAALRANHPYEEPAFDLLQLAAGPSSTGQGRIGSLQAADRGAVIERIKQALNLSHLLIAGPTKGPITRAACCAGSCGDLLNDALKQGAQLYLTGEMRHHDALKAAEAGMTVVCTLHSNSERATLTRVASRLAQAAPIVTFLLSQSDRDPFSVV
jgi:dinuclear metal center YbgI/SA1388 family protein